MTIRKLFLVIFILSSLLLTGCDVSKELDPTTYDIEYMLAETTPTPKPLIHPLELLLSEQISGTNLTQHIFQDPETNVLYTVISGKYPDADSKLIPLWYSEQTLRMYNSDSPLHVFKLLHKESSILGIQHILYDPESKIIYCVIPSEKTTYLSPLYNSDKTLRTYDDTQMNK